VDSKQNGRPVHGFIKDLADGKENSFLGVNPAIESKSKTRKISEKDFVEQKKQGIKNERQPIKQGILDSQAIKLIKGYNQEIDEIIKLGNKKKASILKQFLLKRKLHALLIKEFNLWVSCPKLTKSHGFKTSSEVISLNLQELINNKYIQVIQEIELAQKKRASFKKIF
jgi:hypothetical protein